MDKPNLDILRNKDAPLVERLRNMPDFWLNGTAWMMGTNANPLCVKAADALQRRDALLREAAVYLSEWSGAGNKEAGKLWKRIGIELSSK